jgi:competence protein ComEC
MIRACVSLLAGAYAPHFTSFAAISDVAVFACVTVVTLLSTAGRLAAASFLAGLVLFVLVTNHVTGSRLDQRYEGDSMLSVLRVVNFPRRRGASISFLAEPVSDSRFPPRIRISWYDAPALPALGELWQFELRMKRPRGTSNPGGFDYETWLFRERIGATGYIVNGKRNQRVGVEAGPLVDRWRGRFVRRVTSLIDDPGSAAVIAAIGVGTRHLITPEQWLRYAQSGTTHLMAISGLHVGLAAAATFSVALACLTLLRRRGNHRRAALVTALAVAACYASLSGFAVPAERALLMFSLLALALITMREPDGTVILARTCMLVVLGDPLTTLMPGFQLSFAAVLLLLWLSKRRFRLAKKSVIARIRRSLENIVAMQGFLFVGLMPLTILNFNRVSVVSPFINFVAVPLFSLATVPLTLAGLVLDGPVAPSGDVALRIAAASITWLESLITHSLALPYATFVTPQITGMACSYLALVLLWVLLPRGWPGRYVAWLGFAAVVVHRVDGPPEHCFDATTLDVGQGLAVLIRTRDKTLLYDTGAAYPGGTSMAHRVVLPYLTGRGIERIDRLVVSHSDNDHAGGVADILVGVDVGSLWSGEPLDGIATAACRRGDAWRWNGVGFRFLQPRGDTNFSGNNASCVLQVEAGESRFLLTGDIEIAAERALLADAASLRADAVVVPHHGSRTSSSPPFVEAVAADLALVSAGYRNRWGLPKGEVTDRWRKSGADVLTTAHAGAISLLVCADGGVTDLRRNRDASSRIWHEPARE